MKRKSSPASRSLGVPSARARRERIIELIEDLENPDGLVAAEVLRATRLVPGWALERGNGHGLWRLSGERQTAAGKSVTSFREQLVTYDVLLLTLRKYWIPLAKLDVGWTTMQDVEPVVVVESDVEPSIKRRTFTADAEEEES